MEKVRKISKKYYLRQIIACWLVCWMGLGLPLQVARAIDQRLPSDPVVVPGGGGVGSFDYSPEGQLHIRDVAHQTIIEWGSFNIGTDALTEFHQIGVDPAVLNRITGGGPASEIFGILNANGRVFIVNPAGIIFGPSASVNVAQLVASSLDILNSDFRDGLPYTFTGGATAGDVINEGITSITAEQIALIGKQVINRGALVASDYVIMAAGDRVVISESSPILVQVSMPEGIPGEYEYIVDQGGSQGTGSGTVEADHVILAAGDIWSTAIKGVETLRAEAKGNVVFQGDIEAYAEPGSDAVADVTIITGGDFTVDHEITAEAEAEGSGNNSSASIKIDAGGSVTINDHVKAEADAEDYAGDAEAVVDIDAGESVIVNENGEDDMVEADAFAGFNSGNATAELTITAGTDVTIDDSIKADADAIDHSGNATANLDITATGNVNINETNGDSVEAEANAENHSGDAGARISINAGEDVVISEHVKAEADAENYSGNAQATVDIDAGGSVTVREVECYMVEADAFAGFDSGDATAGLTIAAGTDVTINDSIKADADSIDHSGNATANVDITATGSVNINETDDESVKAEANTENNSGDATAGITIGAGEDVVINEHVKAEADAENYSGNAQATVDIDADGSVTVNENDEEYMVEADAFAGFDSGDATAGLTIAAGTEGNVNINDSVRADADAIEHSGNATANVDIAAGGSVYVNEHDGGTVKAEANTENNSGDATAGITIDAGGNVEVYDTVESEAEVGGGSGDATANTTVLADGDVTVDGGEIDAEAEAERGSGDAAATVAVEAANVTVTDGGEIEARAEAEKGSGDATAAVNITTTSSDVLVESGGGIIADAEAGRGSGDAKAAVTVAADNVTVTNNSEIEAEANTEHGSGDAEAAVDIDADGDVLVELNSKIMAWADTYHYGSGDATATVDIDATGDVTVIGHEPEGEGTSKIIAHAMTEWPKYEDSSGSATASVDIDADGDVTATRDGKIVAVAVVKDGDEGELLAEGDATADVTINAGGDVTIEKGSEAKAVAHIDNSIVLEGLYLTKNGEDGITELELGDATADVAITADGDVTVSMGGEVKAKAEIYNEAGFPMVEFAASDFEESFSLNLGDATANVDIDAGGDVTVEKGGDVGAEAYIENLVRFYLIDPFELVFLPPLPSIQDLGDATANVSIDSGGDVTVTKGGSVYADAELYYGAELVFDGVGEIVSLDNGELDLPGLGDATANVEITAPGLLTVDRGGEVYAEASIEYELGGFESPGMLLLEDEVENSGDATAGVVIDARGGVNVGERGEVTADAWIETTGLIREVGLLQLPIFFGMPPGDATASLSILTCGDVIVDGWISADAGIESELPGDTSANVLIRAYGDVIVNSEEVTLGEFQVEQPLGGQIEAEAWGGENNSADITILAVGDVIVNDAPGIDHVAEQIEGSNYIYSPEEIKAAAFDGQSNDAHIGIATRGGGPVSPGDIIVDGQIGAHAWNESEASTNTSSVEISAARDVIVNGGYAQIRIPSEGEIVGLPNGYSEEGGQILADAYSRGYQQSQTVSFNTANVEIFAGRDVTVHAADVEYVEFEPVIEPQSRIGVDGGQILAITGWNDDSENTSHIGISADHDVTVEGVVDGDVHFSNIDGGGDGEIIAGAHGNRSTNTAEIEICAEDDVIVDGKITATAGTGADGVAHNAHITIAAGDDIDGSGYIEADADESAAEWAESITFISANGDFLFDGEASPEPVKIVDDVDCPACDFEWLDWTWCADCEPAPTFVLAPPIVLLETPMIVGCPVEMGAAALELGITGEAIQVAIADAFALNPSIQPCQACATLIDAAVVLRDEDGSRMAAMVAAFNELAPAGAPFTPEMSALIATAFADAAEGSQYASAAQYIDAFVRYVAVLDTDLGTPVGDSIAFVMAKYGAGVTGSDNANIAAFVAARLESRATFAR